MKRLLINSHRGRTQVLVLRRSYTISKSMCHLSCVICCTQVSSRLIFLSLHNHYNINIIRICRHVNLGPWLCRNRTVLRQAKHHHTESTKEGLHECGVWNDNIGSNRLKSTLSSGKTLRKQDKIENQKLTAELLKNPRRTNNIIHSLQGNTRCFVNQNSVHRRGSSRSSLRCPRAEILHYISAIAQSA